MKKLIKKIKTKFTNWKSKVKEFNPDYYYIDKDDWNQLEYIVLSDFEIIISLLNKEVSISLKECELITDLNKRELYLIDIINFYTNSLNITFLLFNNCKDEALRQFNLLKPDQKEYYIKLVTDNNDSEFIS